MAEPEQPPYVDPNADYYDRVHRVSWLRRTSGIFTGATLGSIYGGLIGTAASFLPYVLGAIGIAGAPAVGLATAAAVGSNAALFASIGAVFGIGVCADVGVTAGAVASGLEEQDRRVKLQFLKRNGTPLGKAGVADGKEQPADKPLPESKPFSGLFNWKVSLVAMSLFAVFGAMLAINPVTAPTVTTALGLAAASKAAIIASAAILGMFGALMGITNSRVSNAVSNFYTNLLNGKLFERKKSQTPQPEVAKEKSVEAVSEPSAAQPRATIRKYESFQEMIVHRDAGADKTPSLN